MHCRPRAINLVGVLSNLSESYRNTHLIITGKVPVASIWFNQGTIPWTMDSIRVWKKWVNKDTRTLSTQKELKPYISNVYEGEAHTVLCSLCEHGSWWHLIYDQCAEDILEHNQIIRKWQQKQLQRAGIENLL